MTDVFLYQGESNPSDVKLRDPTTPGAKVDYVLTCAAGAYAYAGQAAVLTVARNLSLAAGAYSYTGQAASLTVSRNLALDAGAYAYAGNDATLDYVPGAAKIDYTLDCEAGAYVYTGQDAVLAYEPKTVFLSDWVPPKRTQKKDNHKRLNDERRAEVSRAFDALIGHPEPLVVREVREIVGSSSLEELAPEKVTQLLTLQREIDEEDEVLLLLI